MGTPVAEQGGGAPGEWSPARAAAVAVMPAAVAAVAWLIVRPPVGDMAAQVFRADLAGRSGLIIWDGQWYGGHHLPGYSILMPLVGGLLGAWWAGFVAAIAALAAMSTLAAALARHDARRAGALATLLSIGVLASLLCGRTTWLLGIAFGGFALGALMNARRVQAVILAILTPLASPVAGVCLALCALSIAIRRSPGWRTGALAVAASLAPIAILAVLFPEGGRQPFPASTFIPMALATAALLLVGGRAHPTLRTGAVLYLILLTGAWLVPTPFGSNALRLGELAGPAAAFLALVGSGRAAALIGLLAATLVLQWIPPVNNVRRTIGDASTTPAFYLPLTDLIRGRGGPPGRLEVVPTRNHWESAFVAPGIPLARGWERQLDNRWNGAANGSAVDPAAYRRWLDSLAVRWVALPAAPLDRSAGGEARLLEERQPWLMPVRLSKDWQVWEVTRPTPLATGSVKATRLSAADIGLVATGRGSGIVRVRWSRWWRLDGIRGCVRPGPAGMTAIDTSGPGVGALRIAGSGGGPQCG